MASQFASRTMLICCNNQHVGAVVLSLRNHLNCTDTACHPSESLHDDFLTKCFMQILAVCGCFSGCACLAERAQYCRNFPPPDGAGPVAGRLLAASVPPPPPPPPSAPTSALRFAALPVATPPGRWGSNGAAVPVRGCAADCCISASSCCTCPWGCCGAAGAAITAGGMLAAVRPVLPSSGSGMRNPVAGAHICRLVAIDLVGAEVLTASTLAAGLAAAQGIAWYGRAACTSAMLKQDRCPHLRLLPQRALCRQPGRRLPTLQRGLPPLRQDCHQLLCRHRRHHRDRRRRHWRRCRLLLLL